MKIGILGAGRIGGTIAGRLSSAGHEVRLANSRDPETIREFAESLGVTAMHASDATADADVVITAVPFPNIPALRTAVRNAPPSAVVIDTSNYFPFKDGEIPEVGNGEVESLWVEERLGRPIIKAWNNIIAGSFAEKAALQGAVDRIALAVAGDDGTSKSIAMDLVELTGFDAVDSGRIADSWRQQPGAPAYCTELDEASLRLALARADRNSLAERRELMVAKMLKLGSSVTNEDLLRLGREIYL